MARRSIHTAAPTSPSPTTQPTTHSPTALPTVTPSFEPTVLPTLTPSLSPTYEPSVLPTTPSTFAPTYLSSAKMRAYRQRQMRIYLARAKRLASSSSSSSSSSSPPSKWWHQWEHQENLQRRGMSERRTIRHRLAPRPSQAHRGGLASPDEASGTDRLSVLSADTKPTIVRWHRWMRPKGETSVLGVVSDSVPLSESDRSSNPHIHHYSSIQ